MKHVPIGKSEQNIALGKNFIMKIAIPVCIVFSLPRSPGCNRVCYIGGSSVRVEHPSEEWIME